MSFVQKNYKTSDYNYQSDDAMVTKLLSPQNDPIFHLLKEKNIIGLSKNNFESESSDWICFISVFNHFDRL